MVLLVNHCITIYIKITSITDKDIKNAIEATASNLILEPTYTTTWDNLFFYHKSEKVGPADVHPRSVSRTQISLLYV